MKKFLSIVLITTILFIGTIDVKADDSLPIKSINFCGVTTEEPTSTVRNVTIRKGSNDCKISVELIGDGYTLYDYDNNNNLIEFNDYFSLQQGLNQKNIAVKNSNGQVAYYRFFLNYVNTGGTSSSEQENPSTGDNQILYLTIGLVSLCVIAISYNRIIKYSKEQ